MMEREMHNRPWNLTLSHTTYDNEKKCIRSLDYMDNLDKQNYIIHYMDGPWKMCQIYIYIYRDIIFYSCQDEKKMHLNDDGERKNM